MKAEGRRGLSDFLFVLSVFNQSDKDGSQFCGFLSYGFEAIGGHNFGFAQKF